MPELPEVETIRQDLNSVLSLQKISKLIVFNDKSVLNNTDFFINALLGRKIKKIGRRGKLLIFYLQPLSSVNRTSGFDYLLIHLKMTGQLIYQDKSFKISGGHSLVFEPNSSDSEDKAWGGPLPNKYTCLEFHFKNGSKLFFNDLRRFGYLKIVKKEELDSILKNNYGPEPLSPDFSLQFFRNLCQKRKMKIKALLLSQRLIAGLGNIYTDESLWKAKIHPERLANSLDSGEIKKLYQAINSIIKKALKYRGTSFNNYLDAQGKKGNFSLLLKVYGRSGQACPRCSNTILKTRVAGRGTSYCPFCQ